MLKTIFNAGEFTFISGNLVTFEINRITVEFRQKPHPLAISQKGLYFTDPGEGQIGFYHFSDQ